MNNYTDKELSKIIDNLVILVDSREKSNAHILKLFDKHNIKYEIKKLNSGDYSGKILKSDIYNNELSLENIISVERKASLEELSGNLTKEKDRFQREFDRSLADLIIMIEGASYKDLATHNYKTNLPPKSFLGILHSFCDKNNSSFFFVEKDYSALFIYNIIKYRVRNILKEVNKDEFKREV